MSEIAARRRSDRQAYAKPEPPASGRVRVESIDLVRGIIMIVMALDHVRDFFGAAGINPTDPATTTVALFFTRWVTHFCAPVFFLLTGTGAYLKLQRSSRREMSRYLFTRGLWLIVLDGVVVRCLGLQFNFDYRVTILNVLWALGWSMIALSALVHLRASIVTAFGVAMIASHNLLDGVKASTFGSFAPLWSALHVPSILYADAGHLVLAPYVLIPWIGVMAAGFGLGQVFDWSAIRRRAFLLRTGLAMAALFVVLRAANVYGDPSRWSAQKSAMFTVLSFLNTTKYPPSLLFLLMTLSGALLLLRAFDGGTPAVLRPAVIYGKVPLFYFLVHLPVIHLLAVGVCYVRFGEIHSMFESPTLAHFPVTQPPGWPLGLPLIYLIWIGVVAALYPLCRRWAGLKRRRNDAWLSYL